MQAPLVLCGPADAAGHSCNFAASGTPRGMPQEPDGVRVTRQVKGTRDMMGEMMGTWMIVWGLLSLALLGLAVAGGIWVVRTLAGRETGRQASGGVLPPDVAEAQAVLRRRYAAGEISREDYLQAKVELEMT